MKANPRLISRLTLLMTAVSAWSCAAWAMPTTAPAARDWKRYPAVVELQQPDNLFALGDVHGDAQRLAELLVVTHLIASAPATPDSVEWTAGNAVLICTGDLIDKYDHSREVIQLMRALQSSAAKRGGRVIVTMGNHEAEFLAGGGKNRKAAEFTAELEHDQIDPRQIADGTDDQGIGEWLRNLPVAAKVGDWFFCHAGNTAGRSVERLESDLEHGIDTDGFKSEQLLDPNSILEARMHPRPWWDWNGSAPQIRSITHSALPATTTASTGEAQLQNNLRMLNVQHLVFGHQPGRIQFADGTVRAADEMTEKFNGLVFFIDTGMSRGVDGGRGAILYIFRNDSHTIVTAEFANSTSQMIFRN